MFPLILGICIKATIITSIVIGTLIRNTEPHQNLVNNKPPIKGPKPAPADAIEDQIPSASALSFCHQRLV